MRENTQDTSTGLDDVANQEFKRTLKERKQWYDRGRKLWSFAYHSILFVSIISSAAAAVIPQLKGVEGTFYTNLASILAGLAAVLLTLSTAGGLDRKWKGNRISGSRIRDLEADLIGRSPTVADKNKLREIQEIHDKAILG